MTIRQKQCLLEYLGYYLSGNSSEVNNIDGLWGPASKEATRRFQQDYGLASDGIFGPVTEKKILTAVVQGGIPGTDWDLIRYFGRGEFMCNCGGKYCNGFPAEPDPVLVTAADEVRSHFGAAAIVSSGVRCPQHNANVGGVANSRHLTGKAMDFTVRGYTAAQVLEYVQQLQHIRYAYDIDGTYIHMDVQ